MFSKVQEKKEDLNKSKVNYDGMGLTYWQRTLLGAAGGILIIGSFWGFTKFVGEWKFLMIIPIALGILAIFYGRYG